LLFHYFSEPCTLPGMDTRLHQFLSLPLEEAKALLAEAEDVAEFMRRYIALAERRPGPFLRRTEEQRLSAGRTPHAPRDDRSPVNASDHPPVLQAGMTIRAEIRAVMDTQPPGTEWSKRQIADCLPHRSENSVLNVMIEERKRGTLQSPRKGVWRLQTAAEAAGLPFPGGTTAPAQGVNSTWR
jgi:hypothetical protein